MVRRTDHPAQPRSDPEVVLGRLPAPGLGAEPRGGLRPDGSAGGRAAGRDPCTARADPPGLAAVARRARRSIGWRPRLRPGRARPRPGTGPDPAGLPAAGALERCT